VRVTVAFPPWLTVTEVGDAVREKLFCSLEAAFARDETNTRNRSVKANVRVPRILLSCIFIGFPDFYIPEALNI
jgi:hypothetical protein